MNTNTINLVYLFLLAPLHTGGTTQEGNLLGIARESHTNLPYIPSSSIRGRLRSSVPNDATIEGSEKSKKFFLFGNEIADGEQLEQGAIWIGDGAILWIPIPSLSHGVIWISSPFLLQRWARLKGGTIAHKTAIPEPFSTNLQGTNRVYLKDVILRSDELKSWDEDHNDYIPCKENSTIDNVLVLPDKFISTIVQMSLWRQVKIKLDEHKTVDGGFRYEEAIPPDTLMYFPWGVTSQVNNSNNNNQRSDSTNSDPNQLFRELLSSSNIIQIGGQESLGRGFVQIFYAQNEGKNNDSCS